MKIPITKSARRFGYVIWNGHTETQFKDEITSENSIPVRINKINLGEKKIDWLRHRIYIGYGITRGLDPSQLYYVLEAVDGIMEVSTSEK